MMEMKEIDARNLQCPQPVILTKQTLAEEKKAFAILVDNEAAKDNVKRFAESRGCKVRLSEEEGYFRIEIIPEHAKTTLEHPECSIPEPQAEKQNNKVIFITSDEIGKGERKLGTRLASAFIYACAQNEEIPHKIIFMNTGVRLVTQNEEIAENLKRLEERGCEMLVCGTCLDFYGLKDSLLVGRVSNMYEIQSTLIAADTVVSL
ncbi:MAG: sulfurtransferase-like selenium metabolism protein YedF [Actinomycetota bacterium]|nr:sulfurtransferase-like selenium metabolism protein YedF [Actinomycetota bacterium]